MMKKRKKVRAIEEEEIPVVLFAFAFLAIICTLFFYSMSTYKNITTIDMRIQSGGYVGFNLDDRYLEFGTTMPGGFSERNIEIHNTYDQDLFVEIDIAQKKDLYFLLGMARKIKKEWVTLTSNNFILNTNETRSVKFTVKIPEGTEYGEYIAQAVIKFSYVEE